jgi:ABC-type nitrate/sulfonate/bicarbonate transport system substrate-binding protein
VIVFVSRDRGKGIKSMKQKYFYLGWLVGIVLLACTESADAASEPLKLKIIYSSFTGAYTPLWLAVDDHLGRKYGLEFEAVYAGRARPHQLLLSGDSQYVISTGTGVVSSYAVGAKDLVIIASFIQTTGSSIFSKPQVKTPKDLRGKNLASGRPGAVTDILLHYILKRKFDLEPGRDVKIVNIGDTPAILPALEKGVVDAAMLTTPARLVAKKAGFRELVDFDELGVPYPYVGISTLKATVKKNPDVTLRLVRTLTDGIQVFKTNKERSLNVMKKYLRGASDEMLLETYNYFSTRMPKLPYPSVEAIKVALEMMADQFPQATSVDPNEVIDLTYVKQIEAGGGAR